MMFHNKYITSLSEPNNTKYSHCIESKDARLRLAIWESHLPLLGLG